MPEKKLTKKFADGDRGTNTVFGIIRLWRRSKANNFKLKWDENDKKWEVTVLDAPP